MELAAAAGMLCPRSDHSNALTVAVFIRRFTALHLIEHYLRDDLSTVNLLLALLTEIEMLRSCHFVIVKTAGKAMHKGAQILNCCFDIAECTKRGQINRVGKRSRGRVLVLPSTECSRN